MKKIGFGILLLCLLLGGCTGGDTSGDTKVPSELVKLEDSLSTLYNLMQNDGISRHETPEQITGQPVEASGAPSALPAPSVQSAQTPQPESADRNYLRLKEIYKLWNKAYPQLQTLGIEAETLQKLDGALNEMGMALDAGTYPTAMAHLNDAMLIISDLYARYGETAQANLVKLEYHVNQIFLEAGDPEAVSDAIAEINCCVDQLCEGAKEDTVNRLERLRMCAESTDSAAQLGDAGLVELKNTLLKDELKSLKKVLPDALR